MTRTINIANPMPARPRILLLCAEEPEDGLALQVVLCLAAMRARVVVVSDGREPLYRYSRYVSRYETTRFPRDTDDDETFAEWLTGFATEHRIDVVCGTDILTTRLAARAAARLGNLRFFPCAPLAMIDALDDKWTFFRLLRRLGLPTPQTIRIVDWTLPTRRRIERHPFPVVVKPPALSGGRGIHRFDDIGELNDYLHGAHPFNRMPLLIQSYRGDRDIGLGFMAKSGRLVAHNVQIKEPGPGIGKTYRFTDRHPDVVALGARIVAETKYAGPGFIDMRLDDRTGRVYVLEFNPRLWFSVAKAMHHRCNYLEIGLQLAFGSKPSGDTRCRPGTYYSLGALPARLRQSPLRPASKRNLRGLWMELADPAAVIYRGCRLLLARMAGRKDALGPRLPLRQHG